MMQAAAPNSTSTVPSYACARWPAQRMSDRPSEAGAAMPLGLSPDEDSRRPVILHFGRDQSLLSSRSLVLQLTGFDVKRCESLADVNAMLEVHTQGLLVLCHSLTEAARAEVLSKIQGRQGFRSLLMARNSLERQFPLHQTEAVSSTVGPHGLVKKAAELLSREWASRSPHEMFRTRQ